MQFDESCEEFAMKKMIAQNHEINVSSGKFSFRSCFKQNKNGEMQYIAFLVRKKGSCLTV